VQNRSITRTQSLKESYPEFAEAIIAKLKSYFSQCEIYHNQSLKEFRELLMQFEIATSLLPKLMLNDIYVKSVHVLESEIEFLKNKNVSRLNDLDMQRVRRLFAKFRILI
jgi:hypothetical protein